MQKGPGAESQGPDTPGQLSSVHGLASSHSSEPAVQAHDPVPAQVPALQTSPVVQASPSLHVVPDATLTTAHVPDPLHSLTVHSCNQERRRSKGEET